MHDCFEAPLDGDNKRPGYCADRATRSYVWSNGPIRGPAKTPAGGFDSGSPWAMARNPGSLLDLDWAQGQTSIILAAQLMR